MPKILNLVGQRYGALTVVAFHDITNTQKRWRCVCDCGGETLVLSSYLRGGDTRSCGCLLRRHQREGSVSHGHNRGNKPTPTYNTWRAMKNRCFSPSHPAYRSYGGRGVSVCQRWSDNFHLFLADMGERPAGKTLDRIDPNGAYEPSNCRWATPAEQARNTRRKESKNLHVIAQNPAAPAATAGGQAA